MFLEMFYKYLDIPESQKKFLHYKEFMLQIHEEEHKVNQLLKG